jgi:hypothetical protein
MAVSKATQPNQMLPNIVNFFGGLFDGKDGRKETLYADGAQAVFFNAIEGKAGQ